MDEISVGANLQLLKWLLKYTISSLSLVLLLKQLKPPSISPLAPNMSIAHLVTVRYLGWSHE